MTESTRNVSSPWCSTVQFVCHLTLRATMTSGCRATTCISGRSGLEPERLGRLEERLDLDRRLLAAGRDLLLAAVDPDGRDLQLRRRLDVGVQARRDVDPPLLAADPPRELVEVRGIGLVGADLLSGDHEVDVGRDVAPREAQQLVVDVGDQPRLVLAEELLELRVGLLEGAPARDRVG